MTTYERSRDVLVNTLGYTVEEIKPKSSLWGDLAFDSLKMVQYAMALEDEFGIDMDDGADYERMTVQDIVDIIETKRTALV